MICSSCGAENRAGRKFCSECGAPLAAPCPACGASNEPGEKFCGECGHRLATAAGPAPTADAPSAAPPAAERRLVTVLFADLVGFTSLSEQRDAEEVRELLTRYFDTARDMVHRYGGVVEKFIGDAVMAVWGTPVAHEDDAERAVRAALEMIDAVAALGASVGAAQLRLRAGVLTGEAAVTVGAAGQGMVAGDIVNTASRLQSAAAPGSVLVGRATFQAARRAISFEDAGARSVKGKELPLQAWRALRVVAGRRGFRRAEQREGPFVGRDEELRLIKELFHTVARESRPRLVSVMGIGGIGKSRLAWEFFKYIDGFVETVLWHQGRCPSYGEGVAFWALGEMVRMRAGIAEGEDARASRAKLSAAVSEYVAEPDERRWIEPRLAHLLGLEERPPGEREEMFAAWRSFFEHVSEQGPTVLLFEDLQWADSGLIDFIEHVLEWSRTRPILIITLARPELTDKRPTWGAGQRNFTSLYLEPLGDQAISGLLEGLTPGLPTVAIAHIIERAEGVPLYAVEMVRMLLDHGHLVTENGGYRLTGDLAGLDVPGTLHSLIASRLDALGDGDRSLLQSASVLGKTFSVPALSAVAGQVEELEARLQALVRKELLAVEIDPRSPERGQYGFVQSLIREVAYATLSRRERQSRHVDAARYFETIDDGELAGVIASHYVEAHRAAPPGPDVAELAQRARVALVTAAERAESLGAHRQALTYLEQALAVTEDEHERVTLWERAARTAAEAASFEVAEDYLRRAVELYERRGDQRAAARARALLGAALLDMGRVDDAIALLETVLAGAPELDRDMVEVAAQLARAYQFKVDIERCISWSDRVIAAAERMDLVAVVADALITKGTASHMAGRSHEGLALVTGAAGLAEKHGLVIPRLRALNNMGFILSIRDPREGFRAGRSGFELARKVGSRDWEISLAINACEAAFYSGDWSWGRQTLSELETEVSGLFRFQMGAVDVALSASQGDVDRASALLQEIRPLAEASTAPQDSAMLKLAEAALALSAGDALKAHDRAAAVSGTEAVIGDYGLLAAALAWRAAVWLRDGARARAALEHLRSSTVRGAWRDTMLRSACAGMAALEDRRAEAIAGYLDAARAWRELELRWDLALSQLEFVTLVGAHDPDARAAADEARSIFEELGAKPFLERLDAALAGAP
jgi:class 3 adenylate cyclase/tetratricopeptide (TPR) repeat protein